MKGRWQKERPGWVVVGAVGFAILDSADGPEPVVVQDIDAGEDPARFLIEVWGLDYWISDDAIELWWSDPIKVPPMPEDKP